MDLIIIDASDRFSDYQKRRFNELWKDELANIKEQDFVAIAFVGDSKAVEFRGCKPDDGNWSLTKGFSRPDVDPGSVQARFARDFANPLQKLVASGRLDKKTTYSPIITTILTSISDIEEFWNSADRRRVVLASDLVEIDPRTFSSIKTGYGPSAIKRLRRRAGYPFLWDLNNADIDVYYLERPEYSLIQGKNQREFWKWMLTNGGASSVKFDEVPATDPRTGS